MSRVHGRVLAEPPARLYEMKRKHVEKYWVCVKLAAKPEFVSLPDDQLTTKHCEFAYCEECKMTIYCASGNNEVGKHMHMHHQDLLDKYDADQREEMARRELRTSADAHKRAKKVTRPVSREDQEHANYLLAKWIAESMRPLTLVEDPGFVRYVEYVAGAVGGVEIAIPGRTALREEIRSIASAKRASLAIELTRGCKYYSLTTDLWTDRGLRSFMSTTIHYVDADLKTFSWLLGIQSVPGKHDANRLKSELESVLSEWNLMKSHCAMLLRDGAKNIVNASEMLDLPHMSCVSHSLHLVVGAALLRKPRQSTARTAAVLLDRTCPSASTSLSVSSSSEYAATDGGEGEDYDEEDLEVEGYDAAQIMEEREGVCREVEDLITENVINSTDQEHLERMREILAKFRRIATYFHKSSKGKNRLARFQSENEIKQLILDCPTRWSSTFEMLERFEDLKTPLAAFFDFTSSVGRAEFSDMKVRRPKYSDWLAVKCLSVLLLEFAFVFQRIGGEKYPTMVMVFPLLRILKEPLMNSSIFDPIIDQAREEGHVDLNATIEMMHGVRRSLLRIFSKRFTGMRQEVLWVPLLDPRQAKTKGYLHPGEEDGAKHLMLSSLVGLHVGEQAEQSASAETVEGPAFQSPVRASQRANDRYDDRLYGPRVPPRRPPASEMSTTGIRTECDKEVKRYFDLVQEEDEVDRDTDPNTWWRLNGRRFPMLSELAQKWLGCVGTSVPSERVFSTGGNVVSVKRCSLTPEMVEDLAFIAHNNPAKK